MMRRAANGKSCMQAGVTKQRQVGVRAHGLRAPPEETADGTAAVAHDELIHTTAKHPWLTTDRGFVRADTLRRGEQVAREDGAPAEVVAVAVRSGAADYYNLTVSVLHTYAVGAGQYVVHNCGSEGLKSVDELRSANSISDSANIAYADANLNGIAEHVHAGSGSQNPLGWVRAPSDSDRIFTRALDSSVPKFRRYDSEIKILEHFGQMARADPSLSGTIDLFTERAPCSDLCADVIGDFRNMFGDRITLNVMDGAR